MKYNKEKLIRMLNEGINLDYVLFWKPRKDGVIDKGVFSQWHISSFSENGIVYNCAEQYMMAKKAELMGDYITLETIMKETRPAELKKLGRKVQNFDSNLWDANKYNIVLNASILKFGQSPVLLQYLLSTEDKVLVEASPYDDIWGIALSEEMNASRNPYLWKGENLLGFALMEARDILFQQ